ncbi:MAG: TetR/AcrR family transcriptional regulator [Steroidobacteraceae bacterium]
MKLDRAVRRGRPKEPAKRAALLQAARKLFLDKGIDVVTKEEIAALAGVSKATLYANFSAVTVLLEAVIRTESLRVISDEYLETAKALDLPAQLMQFGERVLKFTTDPERAKFERLLASAAALHAGLGPLTRGRRFARRTASG